MSTTIGTLRDVVVGIVCLVALGALGGSQSMAVAGPLLVLVALALLTIVLVLTSGVIRRARGLRGTAATVMRGLVLLVPFTVLAATARYGLGWDTAQLFASAGLVASGGAVAVELMRAGCGKITGLVMPTLWSLGLSTGWLLLAARLAGGGA